MQLNKKNELVEARVRRQIETQLPASLRPLALGALETCKDVRKLFEFQLKVSPIMNIFSFFRCIFKEKGYKDPCDRMYYSTK